VSVITTELKPFNDWSHIRLDQISSGRNVVKCSVGDFLDVGSGDFMDIGSGSSQELDFDRARAIGRAAAYGVNGCVINASGCITVKPSDPTANHVLLRWAPPPFGVVAQYLIFRKDGDASSTGQYSQIGTTTATSFVDPTQLPVGKTFTYYVQTQFSDGAPLMSGTSNLAVVVISKK
jgi:hypothetical protein